MLDETAVLGRDHRAPRRALDTFPAPEGVTDVQFTASEVTAFCPVTSQPDTYVVEINYEPVAKCIESKSLKLYLWSFRDEGAFCEHLAATIAKDVHDATEAPTVVRMIQTVRGGIVTVVTAKAGQ